MSHSASPVNAGSLIPAPLLSNRVLHALALLEKRRAEKWPGISPADFIGSLLEQDFENDDETIEMTILEGIRHVWPQEDEPPVVEAATAEAMAAPASPAIGPHLNKGLADLEAFRRDNWPNLDFDVLAGAALDSWINGNGEEVQVDAVLAHLRERADCNVLIRHDQEADDEQEETTAEAA